MIRRPSSIYAKLKSYYVSPTSQGSPKVPQNGHRQFNACWSLPCVWSICNLLFLELNGNWRKKILKLITPEMFTVKENKDYLMLKLHKNSRLNSGLQRLQLPCVLERTIVLITITTLHGGEFHFVYFAICITPIAPTCVHSWVIMGNLEHMFMSIRYHLCTPSTYEEICAMSVSCCDIVLLYSGLDRKKPLE